MFNITDHQGNTNQNYNEKHLTPVRMANINNTRNNRYSQDCGESRTLLHCWWECKLVQPFWKTVWRFLKKLKIELPYNPTIVLLGIYPKNIKILIERNTCTPTFISALSIIARLWKCPKCPSAHEWIKERWFMYTMEYYSAGEKKE